MGKRREFWLDFKKIGEIIMNTFHFKCGRCGARFVKEGEDIKLIAQKLEVEGCPTCAKSYSLHFEQRSKIKLIKTIKGVASIPHTNFTQDTLDEKEKLLKAASH
jgi:hypothetical protein